MAPALQPQEEAALGKQLSAIAKSMQPPYIQKTDDSAAAGWLFMGWN